jgi:hypothetical protein
MNIPNFIVVGAHKAGTTSLHHYLDQHPDIYLPPNKGLDLLCQTSIQEISNAEEYLAQFEQAEPGKILGEVSSVYLHVREEIVGKIKHLFPNVKIVAVLRNPIERTYSHALWKRTYTRDEIRNFDNLVMQSKDFLIPGLYATHLKTYFSYFERENIKVLLHEDLIGNPHQFFEELFGFIGADEKFIPDMSKRYHSGQMKIANPYRNLLKEGYKTNSFVKSIVPKTIRTSLREVLSQKSTSQKPPMSTNLKAKLVNYFHDDVVELQKLIGLDVSHWLC